MKTKILSIVLVTGLSALAAWLVNAPNRGQADEVPEKYRATVAKGLEYLAKNQAGDGHWEGDGGKHPVAMTGLVGLALLMERNKPGVFEGRVPPPVPTTYSANIRKAMDWLMSQTQVGRDGLIFSEHASETTRYMEGHGLATLFLAGALREERDPEQRKKLTDVLTRAVRYIVKAHSTQGGWYHTSKAEGHDFDGVLPSAIQIQALQAAENARIPVPREVLRDGQHYLETSVAKYEEGVKGEKKGNRTVETVAGLACCFRRSRVFANGSSVFVEQGPDEITKKWFAYCQTEIPAGSKIKLGQDELVHYYYAQALFLLGGDNWTGYRTATFDYLQSSQNKDGSWPSSEGISTGQVYASAIWSVILQLDQNSHPSSFEPETVFTF